jgi:predicted dehydrogenase
VRREVTVTNPQSPRFGETVPVTAPQNATATLDFANGAIASLQVAKESYGYTPRLEIYGTEGILYAPDPNIFGGPIRITRADRTSEQVALKYSYTEDSRGIGLADMAQALRSGRPHRASGDFARHMLEITLAVFESSRLGRHIEIDVPRALPTPLPVGLANGQLD